MLGRLLLLFIVVPIIELFLLIELGKLVGTIPTISLIMITGFLGAFLVRRQGIQVMTRIRTELQGGQLPAESIFDGAVILVAGAFLMTPGVLTDIFGFLCLLPATRSMIKQLIWARLQMMVQSGNIFVATHQTGRGYRKEPDNVIIIDPDD